MMAVDTNILVYAHRPEFPFHQQARTLLADLAGRPSPWAIALHCLVEFAGVVSHPRRFLQPSTPQQITDQIAAWRECPSLWLLEDGPEVLSTFLELLQSSRAFGPMVHDARIAAACLASGVTELLTCDRDYGRFPALHVRNPFV